MLRSGWRRALGHLWPVRIALGAMFVYSAVPKLLDIQGTVGSVLAYRVLPSPLAEAFGYFLPFAELALGLLLLAGFLIRPAAAAGMALMLSFIVAIAVNLARGDRPDCGCFSIGGGSTLDWPILVRDVVLLAALALPFLDEARRFSVDRWIASAEEQGEDEVQAPTV